MIDTELSSIFKSCADSIRSKTGNLSATYTPYQLSAGIQSIESSSSKWFGNEISDCFGYVDINGTFRFQRTNKTIPLKTITFNGIKHINMTDGNNAFTNMFYNRKDISAIIFPDLVDIYATSIDAPFTNAFYNMSQCELYAFPELSSVRYYALNSVWKTGNKYYVAEFPKLKTIESYINSRGCFYGNNGLYCLNLPECNQIFGKNTFGSCTNLSAIHFAEKNKTTIERMSDYTNNFGATNATIYFDL